MAAFAAWGADLLVCVGGDGLASYAADAMLASGRRMVMMGIAAGTINAGPIVSIGGEALDSGVLDDLRTESVAAVEVLVDGRHVAYGFNDVVIGDTCLGTMGDRVESLSATAILERGENSRPLPRAISRRRVFAYSLNGAARDASGASGTRRRALGPRICARAVAGVLCNAPYMEGPRPWRSSTP